MKINMCRLVMILIVISSIAGGCKENEPYLYKNEIDSIGIAWVPDLREGIFDVELRQSGNITVLYGETDVAEAKDAIVSTLESKSVRFADSLTVLPDKTLIPKPWGLVNVSVCNIRFHSSYSAEMVTQALMGTPLKILKKAGGWLLVQTPDRYIGWVDLDAIEMKSESDHERWKASPRLFYTGKTGDIFQDQDGKMVISDIVPGCIIELTGETAGSYIVSLPDGRSGYIPRNSAIPFERLDDKILLNSTNLVKTAESFMGVPYLWGGTSSKGFDCSGFVKTIYYLNGIIISRDASLQFRHGIRIRRAAIPDSLKPGDLLFFGTGGRGRPRPTHVAMYIGDTEFIHSSGMVRVNSLDSTRFNYSGTRRESLLGGRRLIGALQEKGLEPVLKHNWYK